MKRTSYYILALAFASFFITACSDKEEATQDTLNKATEVAFNVSFDENTAKAKSMTRVNNNNIWDIDDSIGIFANYTILSSEPNVFTHKISTDAVVTAGVDNLKYVTDAPGAGVSISAADDYNIYYNPLNLQGVDFRAYYPYHRSLSLSNIDQRISGIITDTAVQAHHQDTIDYLWDQRNGYYGNPCNFKFKHLMSKVTFRFVPGVGLTAADLVGMKWTFSNVFCVEGWVDMYTGQTGLISNYQDISNTLAGGSGIDPAIPDTMLFFPQKPNEGTLTITLATGDIFIPDTTGLGSSTLINKVKLPTLKAGKNHVITISVNLSSIEIEATIKDWDTIVIPGFGSIEAEE